MTAPDNEETQSATAAGADPKNAIELNKIRLDLAWKSFEHYAKQRVTMFNFYIIFAGTLFIAFTNPLKDFDNVGKVQIVIGFLGFFSSAFFLLLDRRNQHLYRMAEYSIFLIEQEFLYSNEIIALSKPDKNEKTFTKIPNTRYRGIVSEQWANTDNHGAISRIMKSHHHDLITYRVLMPIFYGTAAIIFLGMMAFAISPAIFWIVTATIAFGVASYVIWPDWMREAVKRAWRPVECRLLWLLSGSQ
jgi:hypothetical protein